MIAKSPKRLRFAVSLLASALFTSHSQAGDYWWDSNGTTTGFGNTTGTWGTSAFWSDSSAGTNATTSAVTTSSDTVNFGTATLNYANAAIGIASGGVTVNSIVYGAGQSTAIQLGTSGNPIILAGTTPTISVNRAGVGVPQTISSAIQGSAGLTKAGSGLLILSGSNTYTGGTSIHAGLIRFTSTAAMTSGGGTIAVGTGAGLVVDVGATGGRFSSATSGAGSFGGILAGTGSGGNSITYSGDVTVGIDLNASGTAATYSGVIANPPGSTSLSLLKLNGQNLSLTGANTYSGKTIIHGGSINVTSIGNIGDASSPLGTHSTIEFLSAGNLTFSGNTAHSSNKILNIAETGATLRADGTGAGTIHFTANITPTSTTNKTLSLFGGNTNANTISGAISNGAGGTLSVAKNLAGRWVLAGANTYTGSTTITAGTLALGASNTLPDASALSIGAATLDAATFTDTVGTLAVTGAATIQLGSGSSLAFANSSSVAWPGTLNITGTFTPTSLRFGTSSSALTSTQLGKISVNGTGLGNYVLNASGYLVSASAPADADAPTPSPMTWASPPTATGSDSITMTATTATDISGVEYFFDETSGNPGGADSGWQDSPVYINSGLSPSTTYTYTVTARDKSAAQNATAASSTASATTTAPPLATVWNVQIAGQSANQISPSENFIGAASENSSNSTWNRIASTPQSGMVLKKSTGENTSVTLDFTSDRQPSNQNLTSGSKIFNSYIGGAGATSSITLQGLSMANSYDIIFYSDWWWGGDPMPITQTLGSGLSGTAYLNRIPKATNGIVPPLTPDTNPADVASGAGNTGNWIRLNGLSPTTAGELAFTIGQGANGPFNGFQLVATPLAPRADMLSLTLASNPPSIRHAVFNDTNVTLTVPYGTDVTNLAPTYELWPDATCTTPSGTARNFTTPQIYTVTSSDSLVTKEYTVSVVVAPPLPEFTLTAPATWDGRSTITVQPNISNLALLQSTGGTNFTYQWHTANLAVTSQITPGVLTLTRSQGSGPLLVTLTLANGTESVTRSASIVVEEPETDPWVERSPLANEKPVNGQFFARNPFTGLGTIYYRGTQSGTPDTVYVKIYQTPEGGSETLHATHRQALTGGAYDFTATIPAGLFTYRLVYGTTTGGIDTDVSTVSNLLCGDAYVIEGQSNAQATDNSEPQADISNPWIRTYNASLGWVPAYAKPTSPNWGSKIGFWGMLLAQRIVTDHQMPVCIINGAVGGTRIDQHLPNPVDRTVGAGTYDIYANLLNRIIAARLTHGIRGIFWHQGESDCASFGPIVEPDYTAYEQNFLALSSAWKQDFPNLQRYILWQVMPNPCSIGPFGDELRDVQRRLPRLFSRMSMLNTLGISGYEGCHFSKAGYDAMGNRIAPVIARDFYGVGVETDVTTPNVKRAWFTSSARTAIAVEFDQPMQWEMFAVLNFHINGIADQVSSGSASGKIVTLQLTSPAQANSTLTYLKDEWNFNESNSSLLRGANNLPALSFNALAIEALGPFESWAASKDLSGSASAGEADPDQDGVKNALEFVLGGEPNPSSPQADSSALLPSSSLDGSGGLVFTFQRKTVSNGAVTLKFQWSTDLTFPSAQELTIGSTSTTIDGISITLSPVDGSTENIVITVPASKSQGGKLFGRLQAVVP